MALLLINWKYLKAYVSTSSIYFYTQSTGKTKKKKQFLKDLKTTEV